MNKMKRLETSKVCRSFVFGFFHAGQNKSGQIKIFNVVGFGWQEIAHFIYIKVKVTFQKLTRFMSR
jgi:hypothetical protein